MLNMKTLMGYEGKNVVITGSASGMSKAATELLIDLGANVYAIDLNEISLPVKQSFRANLANKEEIDSVIAQLPEKIDVLFLCHGIATKPGAELLVQKIDFLSQKYMAEQLLPRISDNGSVAFISSMGGYGFEAKFARIQGLLNAATWEEAMDWYEAHPEMYDTNVVGRSMDYGFAKQCLNAYVVAKCHAPEYITRKIRLNTICPGDTITGLTDDFATTAAGGGSVEEGRQIIQRIFLDSWGGRSATAEEMGYPLVVIGSNICSYMSGQNIYLDYGAATAWTRDALLAQAGND